MEFGPDDVIRAAERLIRPSAVAAGTYTPTVPAALPKPPSSGLVRTLGPDDPPPFDRVIRPRFSARTILALALVIIFVLPIVASVVTATHR
jgi:hypothetical protein